ncbi:MAG: DUF86 domain-containing protein [Methanotrichaceae archaeon]
MRDDKEWLLDIHILDAIERIEKYSSRGRQAFEEDELIQSWIVHHLQIIGEALRSISEDFRREHREIPWKETVGMRNVLVHRYFELDVDLVWKAVTRDLPDLKEKIIAILEEGKEDSL